MPSVSTTQDQERSAGQNVTQPLLLRACYGEVLERPPVWMMRQAGRYMPEYRAVREKVSFLDLCKTPDLAAEVSLQPLTAFGMDAVIMFSDILVIPEAMGCPVRFTESVGPVFDHPIRTLGDIERLKGIDPNQDLGYVMKILGTLRAELSNTPQTALIGFSGAPWTLASYMIEGGGSRNFTHLKSLMWNEPQQLHRLLEKITTAVSAYLNGQIEAGAQVVQLFDTWAGILPLPLYQQFVQPYHQKIIQSLPTDRVPVILYVNNSPHVIDAILETAPTVMSVDTLTPLSTAVAKARPKNIAVQGNLDPTALFADPSVLEPMVQNLLQQGGDTGYIFNLGHGILPQTPVDNVRLVVNTVKQYQRPR